MTNKELRFKAVNLLAEAWNAFQQIPKEDKHVRDDYELSQHIHAAQNLIIASQWIEENGNSFEYEEGVANNDNNG